MTPQQDPVREALRDVLDEYDRNTCTHEETHRGGSIWTICDQCGRKWADDRGGFKPHEDPPAIARARAANAPAAAQGEARVETVMDLADTFCNASDNVAQMLGANAGMDENNSYWVEMQRARAALEAAVRALAASAPAPAPQAAPVLPDGWQPIESAPKDGTDILIWRDGWPAAYVARWHSDSDEIGWSLADDNVYTPGAVSNGFVGWQEDIDNDVMPTHWAPLPAANKVTTNQQKESHEPK